MKCITVICEMTFPDSFLLHNNNNNKIVRLNSWKTKPNNNASAISNNLIVKCNVDVCHADKN